MEKRNLSFISIFIFLNFLILLLETKQESLYKYNIDENIYNINEKTYIHLLSQGLWIVEFYAPWCQHCQQLAPEWKKLAQLTKNVMGVAATNMELEGKFIVGIEFYPTIKLYLDGDVIGQYEKGNFEKSAFSIFNWAIQTYQAHIIKSKNTKEDLDYFSQLPNRGLYAHDETDNVVRMFGTTFNDQIKEGVWVVNFYAPWCGHCKTSKDEWIKLATTTKGNYHIAAFNMVDDTQGMNFFIDAYPTINLYYNGKLLATYSGTRVVDDILNFIMKEVENHILNSISTSDIELTDETTITEESEKAKEKGKEEIIKVETDSSNAKEKEREKNKYNLVEITDENYKSFLLENKKNTWVVIFVKEICGICEKEEEILSKLIQSDKVINKINVGIVHVNDNPEMFEVYKEHIFPYYKYFYKGALKKTAFEFNTIDSAEISVNNFINEVTVIYDVVELTNEKHFNNIRYKLGFAVLVFLPISEIEDIKNCEEIVESTERSFYDEYYDIIQYSKEGTNIQYYWVKAHKFPKLQMKFSLYSFPIAVIMNYEKKSFAVMKGKEFNSDSVIEFISNFVENKQKTKSKNFDNLDFK